MQLLFKSTNAHVYYVALASSNFFLTSSSFSLGTLWLHENLLPVTLSDTLTFFRTCRMLSSMYSARDKWVEGGLVSKRGCRKSSNVAAPPWYIATHVLSYELARSSLDSPSAEQPPLPSAPTRIPNLLRKASPGRTPSQLL